MNKVKNNFKNKLTLILVILMVLPILFYGYITINNQSNLIEKNVYNKNMKMAEGLAEEAISLVENAETTINIMSKTDLLIEMDLSSMDGLLAPIVDENPYIANVYVMNTTGMQVYKTIGSPGDRADREYFQIAMKDKRNFSNVIISGSRNVPIIVYAVPIKKNGDIVGVIGASIDLDVLSRLAAETKPGEAGYGFIVESTGKVIAHSKKEMVSEMTDISHLKPVSNVINNISGNVEYTYNNEDQLASYIPIEKTGWGVVVQLTSKEAFQELKYTIRNTLILILVTVIIGIVISYFVSKYITEPIIAASEFAREIACGNLIMDSLTVTTSDEIGKLSKSLNDMHKSLSMIIRQIAANSDQVAASSEELSASGEQVGETADQVGSAMQQVASGAEEQLSQVEDITRNIEELTKCIEQVEVSSGQMSKSADFVMTSIEKGNEAVGNSITQITAVKEDTLKIADEIKTLGNTSREIDNILELINSIAEQTNLLALNAAIEAARAGEAGRGFSVVADEIRELAEESAKATEEIASLIKDIQSGVNGTVNQMDNNMATVENSVDSIERTKDVFGDINDLASKLKEQIKRVTDSSRLMGDNSSKVDNGFKNISVISTEFAGNAEEVAAASEEQIASTEEITSSVKQLAEMAQQLTELVKKFNV